MDKEKNEKVKEIAPLYQILEHKEKENEKHPFFFSSASMTCLSFQEQ